MNMPVIYFAVLFVVTLAGFLTAIHYYNVLSNKLSDETKRLNHLVDKINQLANSQVKKSTSDQNALPDPMMYVPLEEFAALETLFLRISVVKQRPEKPIDSFLVDSLRKEGVKIRDKAVQKGKYL